MTRIEHDAAMPRTTPRVRIAPSVWGGVLAVAVALSPVLAPHARAEGETMTLSATSAEAAAALHRAAASGNLAELTRLLQGGVPVDSRNGDGATALLAATHANQIETARALIAAGADVNAKDKIHDSPYLYAGARGHLEILRLTLANEADLESLNRFGGTALIPAAERGHLETVQTLIEAGVAVDHVNRLGWTALLEAVLLGDGGPRHQQILVALIAGGADVDLADAEGVSPLAHAKARGYSAMVAILTKAGAKQ